MLSARPAWNVLLSVLLVLGVGVAGLPGPVPEASASTAVTSTTAGSAGDCTPLAPEDLAYDAPPVTGSFPAGSAGDCYVLPEPPGSVVQVDVLVRDVDARVRDGNGDQVCGRSGACRLSGPEPYTLTVDSPYLEARDYRVELYRHFGAGGCPEMTLAAFGDPRSSVVGGSLEPGQSACWSLDLAAARHRVSLVGHASPQSWTVSSPSAAAVCTGREAQSCDTQEAGRHSVVVTGEGRDVDRVSSFELALLNLSATEGCGGQIATTWAAAPVGLDAVHGAQVDCRPFSAQPGDRLVLAGGWVADAAGRPVCSRSADLGCVLEGAPPYRLLSPAPDLGPHQIAVRSLEAEGGCPTVTAAPVGAAADDAHPGVACRRFDVPGDAWHVVAQADRSGEPPSLSTGVLYDAERRRACEETMARGRCFLAAGSYWLVQDALTADVLTTLHDLSSDAGCTPQTAGLAPRGGTLAAGEFTCATLDPAVGSNPLLAYVSAAARGQRAVTVHDSRGEQQCVMTRETGGCELAGTAPFHAVVGGGPEHTYWFAYLGDDTSGCRSFAGGGAATEVVLDEDRFAQCLRVPAASADTEELVFLDRLEGAGPVTLTGRDDAGNVVCRETAQSRGFVGCGPGGPGEGYTLVAAQEPGEGTNRYRLRRYGLTAEADGCDPVATTRVGGPSTRGARADADDVACRRIAADPDDRLYVDAREAGGRADLMIFDDTGQFVCKTLFVPCVLTGSSSYQAVLAEFKTRPAGAGPVSGPLDYAVDAWALGSGEDHPSECLRFDDYRSGFGPVAGTLTEERPGVCVVVEAQEQDVFAMQFADLGGEGTVPRVRSMQADATSTTSCGPPYDVCRWLVDPREDTRTGLVLLSLPEGVESLPFELTATCSSSGPCGDVYKIRGVDADPAMAGTTASLGLRGVRLDTSLDVRLVREGHPPVATAPQQPAADRRSMPIRADLTGVAPGVWDLEVTHPTYGTTVLADALTVTPSPLEVVEPPSLQGYVGVDETLTVEDGTWSVEPDAVEYQWLRGGNPIAGADEPSFRVRRWHLGARLAVRVSARHPDHLPAEATSGTARVVKGAAPGRVKPPRIRGVKRVGRVVRATRGQWTLEPTRFRYRWFRDGQRIHRATSRKLRLRKRWQGDRLQVRVTAWLPAHNKRSSISRRYRVRPPRR